MNTTRLAGSLFIVLMLALAISFVACGKKDQNTQQQGQQQGQQQQTPTTASPSLGELKKYPFKSAIVELKYGGHCTGTEVLYIDDYGMKEATVDNFTMKVMGREMPTNQIQVTDGEWVYTIDVRKKEGTKMKNPSLEMMRNMSEEQKKAMMDLGSEMMKKMDAKETGEETVAGKPCKVWSVESVGTKVWVWSGLTLKRELKIMGVRQHLEAVSVETDVPVPADQFEVPQGVRITERDMGKMMREMGKRTEREKSEE